MDHYLTSEQRSNNMRRICKTNTKPELVVRRIAHSLGFRFRLYRRDMPGTPDLVFPRLRKVILVHGCFWHQHRGCGLARIPKSNTDYWVPKLQHNRERDHRNEKALTRLGWDVLVIWECETHSAENVLSRLSEFLSS